jgi:hypothetical protein
MKQLIFTAHPAVCYTFLLHRIMCKTRTPSNGVIICASCILSHTKTSYHYSNNNDLTVNPITSTSSSSSKQQHWQQRCNKWKLWHAPTTATLSTALTALTKTITTGYLSTAVATTFNSSSTTGYNASTAFATASFPATQMDVYPQQ